MVHVRWTTRPTLQAPVVIAAFEGWNDAGDAASTAARYLVDRWDVDQVADIDPEEFYDFTSTRPEVRLDDDGLREIVWPATEIHAGTIPGGDQDVLVIIGTEPQLRWRTYCGELTEIAPEPRRPPVPHPRRAAGRGARTPGPPRSSAPPTSPTWSPASTSSRRATRGPPASSACSTTPGATPASGRRRCGPRCPPTCPGAPSPKAALALIERTSAMLQTWVPTTDLEIAAASYERQVSELVDADEETATYVASLEERHDEDPGTVPSAETIAEEVERFLREQ